MARRARRPEGSRGPDAWVVTYGDMMSLMLVFFVMLVSFSSIQETKFHDAAASLRGAFGVAEQMPSALRVPDLVTEAAAQRARRQAAAEVRELEQSLLSLGLDREVDLELTAQGLLIRVHAPFLFESGRADLRPEAGKLLGRLAATLQRFPQAVLVEGHTDSVPISTGRFPSNWELSAARAVAVARTLQAAGIPPARLTATGCGEWRPLDDNATAAGRERNRRVEIRLSWRPQE